MNNVRALLLTDVVDSTQLASLLGDSAAAALGAAHDRIARDLLQTWHGDEIDKTDGMLMLFENAADAAGYAVAYHQALAAFDVPLKARAGLHVGAVILRANPPGDVARGAKPVEVEGIAKPTAARVMSLAQGGQTLMTAEARAALGPSSLRVKSHGHWRIKGIAEPTELFEVGDANSPFSPPPDAAKVYRVVQRGDLWLPMREVRHSLPAERNAFVGRHAALAELARRFDAGARLVSVLGIGGTGKTRLATRFAWTWLGDFAGGVWFCDLSQARNVDGIAHAVAQGLDVPLGKEDPVAQLGHAIAGRGPCLVILDNFEQVSRHAEETLGSWLDRAAQARFLVTTREVLGLHGEEALALAPLAPPEATELYSCRAASASRDFQPSAEDQEAIAHLVRLLDGLPLAIELAAARVRVMSPRTLLARMDQRFKLLAAVGGRHDRQATLRATFDWSWELLPEPEKVALAQLSVFEGGFALESVEAVLDLSAAGSTPWTVDVLQSLVDKSFVRPLSNGRFDLLGSVQEYAGEHLRTPGRCPGSGAEALAAAQARHFAHFATLDTRTVRAAACVDLENLVVACRRASARAEATHAIGALDLAWSALQLRGPFRLGAELAAVVMSIGGLDAPYRARVGRVAGAALQAMGKVADARDQLEASLALARDSGNRAIECQLRSHLGDLCAVEGRMDEALVHFAEALSIARDVGDQGIECDVLNGLGTVAENLGEFGHARVHYNRALSLARASGDRFRECGTLGNLGALDADRGDPNAAHASYEAALSMARELGHRRWEGNQLSNLGLLLHDLGRHQEARSNLEAALAVARDLGHARLEAIALCNLGIVDDAQDQTIAARSRFESALAVARGLGDVRSEGQVLNYLGRLHARLGHFDVARECLTLGQSLLRSASDRLNLGILLCSLAETEHLAAEGEAARAALAEAESLAAESDAGPRSELGIALARVRGLVGAG